MGQVERLVRDGVAPLLQPFGFSASGLQLTRGPATIHFVPDKHVQNRFTVRLSYEGQETELAALAGRKQPYWTLDEKMDVKRAAEHITVLLLERGMSYFA